MPRCAILTLKDLSDFECYDHLLIKPMKKKGWDCIMVPWDDRNVSWDSFDLAIIRSTWDYQNRLEDFIKVLQKINQSTCILQNSLELVEWNMDKSYLFDLFEKNIEIVPSLLHKNYKESYIMDSFTLFSEDQLVIKPTISANADDTYVINKKNLSLMSASLEKKFSNKSYIIQPYIENIRKEGEYSLIFLGEEHSHTLLKTPKKGDFRVQEEHGGTLQLINETEERILKTAKKVMKSLPFESLYARVDLVRKDNSFLLMEVEVIEPSLYFNIALKSASHFARIVSRKF